MKNKPIRLGDIEFEIGNLVWFNIWDFKLPNALSSCFIAKYVKPYKLLYKSHLDVYTLLLPTTFVAHPTFHVSKLKLFHENKKRIHLGSKPMT
jgi:hypothetical protein